eukprot:1521288-Amphidinium_carterae.1
MRGALFSCRPCLLTRQTTLIELLLSAVIIEVLSGCIGLGHCQDEVRLIGSCYNRPSAADITMRQNLAQKATRNQ